jgi:flagellar biosynthesis protein
LKRAAALKYIPGESAPFLLAKEKGELAERLLGIADEYGIKTVVDARLTESLFYVETGSYIPEYLFEAVATVLAYAYRTRSSI